VIGQQLAVLLLVAVYIEYCCSMYTSSCT